MDGEALRIHCDTCGHITPHIRRGSASNTEELESGDSGMPPFVLEYSYTFTQCDVCREVSLSVYSEEWSDDESVQLYPHRKDVTGTPPEIKAAYQEAKKVKSASPAAFAVMIRRTLEFVCLDQKAKGDDLKEQLDDLGAKNIIPGTLAKMSHVLRDVGNAGAHAGKQKITAHEANVMEDFLLAVIEYVYVAPAKLTRIQEERAKSKE
jgi:Domain of unknown function (DUF4145)